MGLANQVSYSIASMTPAASGANSIIFRSLARGFRNVVVALFPAGTVNFTIKFVKSNQDSIPDFSAAVSSTNQWEYVEVVDLNDGSAIDGTTGVSLAATTTRSFEFNNNTAQWVGIVCTAYTSGTISGNALLADNK